MTDNKQKNPNYGPSPHYFAEDSLNLTDILLLLAYHIKLMIIIPSIFCIVTIIYALFFIEPKYVSTVKFMSSGSKNNNSQMMGLASQFGFSMPSGSVPLWSYTDIIKSRTLARAILNRKFDTKKYGPRKSLLQIITNADEKPNVEIESLIKNGIGSVQGMIKIITVGSMYELEITASEPQLATDIANAVIEELDAHQREYNAQKTTKTRKFIEERITETTKELEASEEVLRDFTTRNRRIENSPLLLLEQQRLAREVSVLTGVFTTLKQQLETSKIEEVKEADYVVMLDPPETPLYPDNPKKKLMVILAGFLGIFLVMVFIFIREYILYNDNVNKEKMRKAKTIIKKNIIDFLPYRFRKNIS